MSAPAITPERHAQLEQVKAALNGFIENRIFANQLAYLWERWQDESEYEDFNDYVKRMEALLTEHGNGLTFIKATKRPFGFQCSHEFAPGRKFAVTVSSRSIGWRLA